MYMDSLSTTMVVVLQVISFGRIYGFNLCQYDIMDLNFEMGSPMSEKQVKES